MKRAHAVFVNGIWKSGNHLLVKLCGLMGYKAPEFGIASSLLHGKHYFARRIIRGPGLERCPVQVGLETSVSISSRWLKNRISKVDASCVGGHAAFSDQLLNILSSNDIRPIQIVRDPRGVAVSFAHWIIKRPDFFAHQLFAGLDLNQRIRAIITGVSNENYAYESLATVMDRSYGWLTRPRDVLAIRFEDLVGAAGGGSDDAQRCAVEAVARWIGVTDIDIDDVCHRLFGGTKTFRSGRVDSWKDDFGIDIQELFNEIVGDRLDEWGYI